MIGRCGGGCRRVMPLAHMFLLIVPHGNVKIACADCIGAALTATAGES